MFVKHEFMVKPLDARAEPFGASPLSCSSAVFLSYFPGWRRVGKVGLEVLKCLKGSEGTTWAARFSAAKRNNSSPLLFTGKHFLEFLIKVVHVEDCYDYKGMKPGLGKPALDLEVGWVSTHGLSQVYQEAVLRLGGVSGGVKDTEF